MPPKPVAKKTTTATKGPAKTTSAPKGTASKGGAAKGGAGTKGATGGAAKAPEKKEEPKVIKKVLVPEEIGLKKIAEVLNYAGDVGLKLKESKRWLYIIDRTENVHTFLKYRDCNLIEASSVDFNPETIRKSLMGALKYGKPLVVNITKADQVEILKLLREKIDEICTGLYSDLMDRSILDEDKCSRMVRDSDDDEYKSRFEYRTSDFLFVILTELDPASTVMEDFFPIIVA